MVKVPKLPEKEELEFKGKESLLSLYEQYQNTPKIWFYALIAVLILSLPSKFLLQNSFAKYLISRYHPPPVKEIVLNPQDLKVFKVQILPVGGGVFSVYAQILNPNPDISSHNFQYEFILKDSQNQILKRVGGQSYLAARESKFLLLPTVTLSSEPKSAELQFGKVQWTKRVQAIDLNFEILQKDTGTTPQGNFFVEGLVRNPSGFGFKKVGVEALVFDQTNQNILAVNSTTLNDLKPFESRYFRMIWPKVYSHLGEVQVIASVNPFDPKFMIEEGKKVPAR